MVDPANNKLPLVLFILLEAVLADAAVDANVNENEADGMLTTTDVEVIYGPELPETTDEKVKLSVK